MSFVNNKDMIHFRHHNFTRPKGPGGENHRSKASDVKLEECGPRFSMRLFRVELGAIDMKDVEVEWVLRPYFNRQKPALEAEEGDEPENDDAPAPAPAADRGPSKKGKGKSKGKGKGKK